MIEHDPVIAEYEHEKSRPREAEALQTLRKIASLVKPIMRQRGWKVGILTEFFPPEVNLLGLNWNRGQKICLRLRYPGDERQFLPIENVVDTMLHELCHIVHGPHNEAFHKLWNQLRSEHESLIRKGYTGEGFLSTGRKLGGGRIPMTEARRRARAAAEKRQTLTAGSGQKLGGAPVQRGQDIRKVIADAATRRIAITKGCASEDPERSRGIVEATSQSGFRTKAEEADADEEAIMQAYIEMIQEEERMLYGKDYIQPSNANPAGSQDDPIILESKDQKPPRIPQETKPQSPFLPSPTNTHPSPQSPTESHLLWTCDICTLANPAAYLCCDACGTERTFHDPQPNASSSPFQSSSSPYQSSSTNLHLPNRPSRPSSTINPRSIPTSTSTAPAPTPNSIPPKPTRAIQSLSTIKAAEQKKPLGWLCHRCGTFMESEWWTCARCGQMKTES